ncbi:protein NDH-DEPENDENT CYCLIC ELECTRON FLOW 5 [Ricinus communis]|uniref:Protein NDH-DEPENDENT CYCLIC ELECTRON FLOW 5 n=1 Tax=Ricinus communis TaxID=3988 RepID=B9SHG8_RICCO|nr:protein NDH-DEPENDENT CYCLIC ELECTRON FLOW 5 [Ricinus communis]XP_015578686.1 protein NDH-DEPENDENT CYCLIC ELECTRON FLOW 5 [Ricinus communis]EEF36927.1 conserved hypothetical protein [Ricinus communis]|eukprot:XP_002525437.1 protein NDH-DEPENDENT CYCLIC ELECTRON FLOW 5 [Ricinus communis]
MAFSSLFSLTFPPISSSSLNTKHPLFFHSYLPSISLQNSNKKREFPLPSVASIPYQPINVDYLEQEFSGHGVTFEDIGDSCIAKMRLENGSTATLMLPSGLITSYKAHMWHGGRAELLQTSVLEGKDGNPVIQGGVSLAFNFGSDNEILWSPTSWALRAIRGNPEDSIQVELISTDAEDKVEVRHVLSLTEDTLSSQLVVSNSKSSSIRLMGSLISHLTVSTPEATYAYGLEGSNFFNRPMFSSNFSIVPPDSQQSWYSDLGLNAFFSAWGARDQKNSDKGKDREVKNEEELEGEEDENYKQLTDKMSRIYTSAPTDFTLIDRGRRNSVIVGRYGFNELYMFSPGSSHESYSMYSYICVGQSAMLKPVILSPGDVWTGGQHLHNPNL